MIVGIGTDLAEVLRIQKTIDRYGDRFLRRIFTEAEIAYASRKANAAERFAARFAAKEAGMKALGTGLRHGITWRDFEVFNEPSGRPGLRLHGAALDIASRMGARRMSLSLTHTSELAMAVVILEDGP
jgi:holo-[acyl-carrier protein] synthase